MTQAMDLEKEENEAQINAMQQEQNTMKKKMTAMALEKKEKEAKISAMEKEQNTMKQKLADQETEQQTMKQTTVSYTHLTLPTIHLV